MCGRVVATASRDELVGLFGIDAVVGPQLPPSYNAAPDATLYAVAETGRGRRLGSMRWGFVPAWSASPRHRPRPINARVESLRNKPMFAEAVDHRTCLIPVDGFYEWKGGRDGKQPFLLQAPDRSPMVLAGLWSRWSAHGCDAVTTFAIVTCPANQDVAPLHHRMPVLVPREDWGTWLDRSDTDGQQRLGLLRPAPPGSLTVMEVSRRVNDARNNGPELLSA